MKKIVLPALFGMLLLLSSAPAFGHCEIPCGIYDDPLRIQLLREHITTIEKSMTMIEALEKSVSHHAHQIIRWVSNKEDHANKFQEIVSQYFMTQRVTPESKEYAKQIQALHEMLIVAMKCKQTTDLAHVEKLKGLVTEFEKLYFAKD